MRVLFIILLFIFSNCTSHKSGNKPEFQLYSDTITEWGMADHNWQIRVSNALNLPRIDQGVDSFELRLWSSLAMTDLQMVTILRYIDSSWNCSASRYWLGKIDEWGKNRSLWADSIQTKKIIPQVPMKSIIDTIEQFEIVKIPTQHQIPNFVDKTADGMTYILEISTSRYYKRVVYRNPQFYNDTINRKLYSFLKFLNRSLNAFVLD